MLCFEKFFRSTLQASSCLLGGSQFVHVDVDVLLPVTPQSTGLTRPCVRAARLYARGLLCAMRVAARVSKYQDFFVYYTA